ncbi:MAG: hypothetical protein H7Y38_18845 [Armatimonadetes bacterium]|nr:hypothetical protein [Armatimonadota bacterium]
MPTPEYRRRCLAEGRCGSCAAKRAPSDTQTTSCRKCREHKNRRHNELYNQRRAQNPPVGISAAPNIPFSYGKTRLQNPRRIFVSCDRETMFAAEALMKHYRARPGYESYSVSKMLRHIITAPHDVIGGVVPPRPKLPPTFYGFLYLCFLADTPAWEVIERQRRATDATIADAVRALLINAERRFLGAQFAVATGGRLLKRRQNDLFDPH